ncbi:hypothetical protein EGJ51_06700 [Pseudomonas fulva]|uniref:hypothetical protein n=1 Tax=Pseudomonas fulva TaxID=47880 RepID=UPI000F796B0A|nr:hypothetical protein [Pseudomonas fulva]RRW63677.1 hypothetical protein EGJ51_06700 [Pseudomonas fulva]
MKYIISGISHIHFTNWLATQEVDNKKTKFIESHDFFELIQTGQKKTVNTTYVWLYQAPWLEIDDRTLENSIVKLKLWLMRQQSFSETMGLGNDVLAINIAKQSLASPYSQPNTASVPDYMKHKISDTYTSATLKSYSQPLTRLIGAIENNSLHTAGKEISLFLSHLELEHFAKSIAYLNCFISQATADDRDRVLALKIAELEQLLVNERKLRITADSERKKLESERLSTYNLMLKENNFLTQRLNYAQHELLQLSKVASLSNETMLELQNFLNATKKTSLGEITQ